MQLAVGTEDLVAVAVVLQDLRGQEGDARVDGLPPGRVGIRLVEDPAPRVPDREDRFGLVVDAHVGDRGQAVRLLEDGDRVAAERQGRPVSGHRRVGVQAGVPGKDGNVAREVYDCRVPGRQLGRYRRAG